MKIRFVLSSSFILFYLNLKSVYLTNFNLALMNIVACVSFPSSSSSLFSSLQATVESVQFSSFFKLRKCETDANTFHVQYANSFCSHRSFLLVALWKKKQEQNTRTRTWKMCYQRDLFVFVVRMFFAFFSCCLFIG